MHTNIVTDKDFDEFLDFLDEVRKSKTCKVTRLKSSMIVILDDKIWNIGKRSYKFKQSAEVKDEQGSGER